MNDSNGHTGLLHRPAYLEWREMGVIQEKGVVELKLKADVAGGKEKKKLQTEMRNAEESVEAMKIARKSLLKFKNAFKVRLTQE